MTKVWGFLRSHFRKSYLKLKVRSALHDPYEIHVKIGEVIVIEGGAEEREKVASQLAGVFERAVPKAPYLFIDANLPKSEWLSDIPLTVPASGDERLELALKKITEASGSFYLVIENADKITDSKIPIARRIIKSARSVIMLTPNVDMLNRRLMGSLPKPRLISLGTARNTYDITYPVIGALMIMLIVLGHHEIVFLAAAMRYIFVGMGRWKES